MVALPAMAVVPVGVLIWSGMICPKVHLLSWGAAHRRSYCKALALALWTEFPIALLTEFSRRSTSEGCASESETQRRHGKVGGYRQPWQADSSGARWNGKERGCTLSLSPSLLPSWSVDTTRVHWEGATCQEGRVLAAQRTPRTRQLSNSSVDKATRPSRQ